MNTEYKVIKQHNSLAAEIYLDRHYYYLTFREIAEHRRIRLRRVHELYDEAREILRHPEYDWCQGLSKRSKQALMRCGYRSAVTVREEVDELHKKESIGVGIVNEVKRWLGI